MNKVKENYLWWQQAGWEWYAEVRLRRETDPIYAQQESFLRNLFQKEASRWLREKGRPLRVLDYGCGFGRHIKYLHPLDGVQIYGCDQSASILAAGRTLLLGLFPELENRLTLVEPNQCLPYEDDSFDVVLTVSVLTHVAPEDLHGRVTELRRVAKHIVLNLEMPPAPHSLLWDEIHNGCWFHNLVEAHQTVGPCRIEVDADALAPRFAIYTIWPEAEPPGARMLFEGTWLEEPGQLAGAMMDACLKYAKSCQVSVQEKFGHQALSNQELYAANLQLAAVNRDLRALENTRAVRFSYWLSNHRRLRWVLGKGFDTVSGFRRWLLRLLGLRREAEEREGPLPQAAQLDAIATGDDEQERLTAASGEQLREDRGY